MLLKIRRHECPARFAGRGKSALTNGLVLIDDVPVRESANVGRCERELIVNSTSVLTSATGTRESTPYADSISPSLLHAR